MGSIRAMQSSVDRLDSFDIGYDQGSRWSFYDRRADKPVTGRTEADCSTMVAAIVRMGGYGIDLADPIWTGNLMARLKAVGFTAITFMSLAQVRAGDVLLNVANHVEFAYSPTLFYSAHIDENGEAAGGLAGDQTGEEVGFREAYIYSRGWDYILRPPAEPPTPSKSVATLAREVLDGKWGVGLNRTNALTAAGYDAALVQDEVNRLVISGQRKPVATIAQEVIAGKWGNQPARARDLQAAGYDPIAVQAEVNRLVAAQRLETVARAVIAGKYGVGEQRITRLTAEGWNAQTVQAEVNRIVYNR